MAEYYAPCETENLTPCRCGSNNLMLIKEYSAFTPDSFVSIICCDCGIRSLGIPQEKAIKGVDDLVRQIVTHHWNTTRSA